jgi:hypothetical protein
MSRIFGEMRQIGIVVRDIDKAMKHWVEVCGVGPWFYAETLPLTAYRYRGREYDIPHLSIALANSGDIQLELIQQRCNTPSLIGTFSTPARKARSTGRAGRSTTRKSATRR